MLEQLRELASASRYYNQRMTGITFALVQGSSDIVHGIRPPRPSLDSHD